MSENDLCDIFRTRNPDSRRFTWRRKTPFLQRRIDYFLVSDSLQESTEMIDIIPSIASNHSAIILELRPTYEGNRGRSYWKFNSSLTEDRQSVNSLKNEIPVFEKEVCFLTDPIMKWAFLKFKFREFSRSFSIQKSKERKARRCELEKRLTELECSLSTNHNNNMLEEYHKCKSELDTLYDYITAGLIIRSKSNWYEQEEKSSKYFLNLEKRNQVKSHIRKLISDSVNVINDPSEILSSIKDFYATLYKHRSTKNERECLEYLHSLNIPKLSEAERNSCEGLLTKKECWEALSEMKNGKSPGNDGLTKEFYMCFFNEICNQLIAALNESFTVGQLSNSHCQATITLIEKKAKDK